jgi:hypothetical protein
MTISKVLRNSQLIFNIMNEGTRLLLIAILIYGFLITISVMFWPFWLITGAYFLYDIGSIKKN